MMLDAHVLVLNKSWTAVNIAPARRALSLLFQGQARVVHPEDFALYNFQDWCDISTISPKNGNGHRYIHTPAMKIRLPEVIVLSIFNGFVRREVRFSRRNIYIRDKNRCQYCGEQPPKKDVSIDHVVPKSRGGKDSWENLVLACVRCNVRKGDRTPREAHMNLIRRPKAPQWLPRFGRPVLEHDLSSWRKLVDTTVWGAE